MDDDFAGYLGEAEDYFREFAGSVSVPPMKKVSQTKVATDAVRPSQDTYVAATQQTSTATARPAQSFAPSQSKTVSTPTSASVPLLPARSSAEPIPLPPPSAPSSRTPPSDVVFMPDAVLPAGSFPSNTPASNDEPFLPQTTPGSNEPFEPSTQRSGSGGSSGLWIPIVALLAMMFLPESSSRSS